MNTVRIVFFKELRDSLRDRRTILTVLFSAVAMGPLVLMLLSQFISGMEEKAARKEVFIQGIQHAPALENYIKRQGYTIKTAPDDAEAQIRRGSFEQAVLRIPADFSQAVSEGRVAEVELVFDDSHKNGGNQGALQQLVWGYSSELGGLRLLARGVSAPMLRPVKIQQVNLASPQARGARLLFMVPMYAFIACLTGVIGVAIDATAGERERGSLEPLLLNPLRTLEVVLGKWAVTSLHGCAVVVLTLSGFLLAMQLIQNEAMKAMFQFGARELAIFVAVLFPFAGLSAAAMMLVATFGRTFKEAQSYASFLLMLVMMTPVLTTFLTLQPAWWQGLVPALGQQLVMERATRGEALAWTDIAVPGAVSVLATLLCLLVLASLLRKERVIFGRN